MRAARAENGRTRGHVRARRARLFAEYPFADELCGKLPFEREKVFALNPNARRLDHRFDVRGELFRHDAALYALCKFFDEFERERIHHAQFQHARFGQGFLHIFVHAARTDDAEVFAPLFDAVDRKTVGILGKFLGAALHHDVLDARVCGHHDVLGDILFVRAERQFFALFKFHRAL